MDSNSINIYPKENSTISGSTSESAQQPNQSQEDNSQGESAQTRTTEIEAGSESTENGNTNQVPEGSTDGSVGGALEGGNNTPDSGSDGTTNSDNENNKDNEVVKNSSFSIKFVRDNEHNKNRIQVELGDKSKETFDSSNAGTFLTVKIYDVNGNVLKSVDILGTDTGVIAKKKIEDTLNNVKSESDSNSNDKIENEGTEQSQTKTGSGVGDNTDSSISSSNGNSQGESNSSNKNDQQFEYFNGQYIAKLCKNTRNCC